MTDTERKELYTDRFCDIGNQIRWVFFDDHNGEGDHVTVYCNYFDADLFEEAVNGANPIDENPLDWLLSECKQYGEDFFFAAPSEEDAAYEEALAAILSYDESAGLIAKGCTHETIEEIARCFGARICTRCGRLHYEGYYVEFPSEYFCSDECLHAFYEPDSYEEMYNDDAAYWTQWWEG